jgi:hypothetical protein
VGGVGRRSFEEPGEQALKEMLQGQGAKSPGLKPLVGFGLFAGLKPSASSEKHVDGIFAPVEEGYP